MQNDAALLLPRRRALLQRLGWLGGALVPLAPLGLVGCASAPPPSPGATREDLPTDQAGATDAAVFALGMVGIPYRYGGNTPEGGFDCSGLVGYVYAHALGLRTPRTVRELQSWGQPVPVPEVRTGDLIFIGRQALATHVGIVVSRRRFVHAPSTGGTVRMDAMDAPYWTRNFREFRRA